LLARQALYGKSGRKGETEGGRGKGGRGKMRAVDQRHFPYVISDFSF
jgi:hypothetical protein